MTNSIPVSNEILESIFDETGYNSSNLSIRETNRLATVISQKGNFDFVRMEMGIPNLPTPDIAKEAEKKAIETAISDLRNALKGTDTEEVKKKTQALIQASMKLGEAVYKSQQKPDGKTPNNKNAKDNKGKDNVVDAEVVDAKEDKEKRA